MITILEKYLQYKMFLLNLIASITSSFSLIFTIQNVPIKSIKIIEDKDFKYIFTIQNVPIKYKYLKDMELIKENLQYKMFLLNLFTIIKYFYLILDLQYKMFLLNFVSD